MATGSCTAVEATNAFSSIPSRKTLPDRQPEPAAGRASLVPPLIARRKYRQYKQHLQRVGNSWVNVKRHLPRDRESKSGEGIQEIVLMKNTASAPLM